MLRAGQVSICVALAGLFWCAAAAAIRVVPASVGPGAVGDLAYVAALPVGWACVWLVCRLARLDAAQILAGCVAVLGVAMMIDGAVLRWRPEIYGMDEGVVRGAATWLLWVYGVSAGIALFVAGRRRSGVGQAWSNSTSS